MAGRTESSLAGFWDNDRVVNLCSWKLPEAFFSFFVHILTFVTQLHVDMLLN